MKVKVTRAYAGFSVGSVIPDMPGGQARTLIGRGFVEEVKSAALSSPNDRAIQANRSSPNKDKPKLTLR